MASQKVSALSAVTEATTDDVLYILNGAVASNKITFDNLQKSITKVGTIVEGGLGTGSVIGKPTMTLGSDADVDIYYRSSGVLTRLAKGTALQTLRINAATNAPEWYTPSGGQSFSKTYTISPSGGDYTTIQAALTANSTGGELFLVYPGTYTDDTIAFTANNQEVRGMGISPNSTKVTTASSNIVDYSTYTGCRINRLKMEVTAATTLVHTVTGTTGSCNLVKCHTSMTTSYATAGVQPSTIHSGGAGTMKISEGTLEYNHTGSNAAIVKALLNCEANNCNITFELVTININASNDSLISGICFGTGASTISVNECDIDIEDNGTAIVVGLYVGGAVTGEFLYNNVHITGTGALAVGMYINAAGADIRTIYNHIHVSGATTNNSFFLNDFASTLTSQFDDIIAVDGINNVGAGTITQVNSESDGNLTVSGTLELGHATDTTLSRSAAGVLAVEGVVIPSISSTNTFTNKRITKRTSTVTQSATPTINTDNTDVAHITGLAQAITSMTTNLSGTPVEGDMLRIDITGTAAREITWGASFEASTTALPTTTVTTARLDIGFVWNSVTSKWRCLASA